MTSTVASAEALVDVIAKITHKTKTSLAQVTAPETNVELLVQHGLGEKVHHVIVTNKHRQLIKLSIVENTKDHIIFTSEVPQLEDLIIVLYILEDE